MGIPGASLALASALVLATGGVACGASANVSQADSPVAKVKPKAQTIVIVRNSGWTEDAFAHDLSDVSYGLVLKNRSRTQDALGVEVTTEMLGPKGGVLGGDYAKLAVIPAGSVFYVGAGTVYLENGGMVSRLRVSIKVHQTKPKGISLPDVGRVKIDRATDYALVAVAWNPYRKAMNMYDASAYAVIYDRNGKLIGGGSALGGLPLYSGESLQPQAGTLVVVEFPSAFPDSRIASARISVDPGYLPP